MTVESPDSSGVNASQDGSSEYLSTGALVMRLVRGYLLPYRVMLGAAMLCMVVAAASQPLLAWLMEPVVRDVFMNHDQTMLVLVPLAIMCIMLIGGAANFGQSVLMNWVGLRIVSDLQQRAFSHLINLDLAFFRRTSTGKLIAHLTSDAYLIRQATSSTLTSLVKDLLTVTFLVALMFYENWRLALVVFFVFPMAAWPISSLGKRMRKVVTTTQVEIGSFTTLLTETFQGVRHVKAYGMEKYESKRAEAMIERLFALYMRATRTRAMTTPMMEGLGGVAIGVVIWYGGSQVIAGESEPGAFFALFTALLLAYRPIRSIANLNTALQEGLAAAQRVFTVLDQETDIVERDDARSLSMNGGCIKFNSAKFSYVNAVPAIRDVTIEVPAGHTVALVGPSGAGKSTLLNLIPRFYDVESGNVQVDGQDVRSLTLHSLRKAIALVSQDIALFDDTVLANIAYGRMEADKDAIVAAAKSAAAHDFIMSLPDGYDTLVGERGAKLSGGESQRIAIARALLKNAPILLLDEATAALDAESEREVQNALATLKRGRTTLVIAHRLATVRDADFIYVLDKGRVVEQGSHDELLSKEGLYSRLYSLQFLGRTVSTDVEESDEIDTSISSAQVYNPIA